MSDSAWKYELASQREAMLEELTRLRAENAAMRGTLAIEVVGIGRVDHRKGCPFSEGEPLHHACWVDGMKIVRVNILRRQPTQQGPVSATPAVTPAGPPSAPTDEGDGG